MPLILSKQEYIDLKIGIHIRKPVIVGLQDHIGHERMQCCENK